ncbi:MAG: UDP-N-acetylglucosamine 1-carboxyvinyltransferase [Candidatus Blackburnbacteria bacterium]|nr:UDP-N-acetylglucosamine 1-carboxyvinyltransferase [Candidatus Blackburnbacteria bacterium]
MDNIDSIKILGGKQLRGTVDVWGAKNVVSKLIVASLLTSESCIIRNVSYVADTELMLNVVNSIGGETESVGDRAVKLTTSTINPLNPQNFTDIAGRSRIPILLCGPMLHRTGQAMIPALGGDKIGERAVNFHIEAIRKLGAKCEERSNGLYFEARKLHGAELRLEYPSVGATEQILLVAVLAEGTTRLLNAAIEPEVLDLVGALKMMGAKIEYMGERVFVIEGVEALGGFDHTAIPDRLEIASWACAAVATDGEIMVRNAGSEHTKAFLEKYTELGGGYKISDEGINFWREREVLQPVNIDTDVYPGFATDWQPPFVVCLTQALGESVVHETVYENRFGYTEALVGMGANIKLQTECPNGPCRFSDKFLHTAIITGPSKLSQTDIEVPDIRAGFSYVIAALVAQGESNIRNVKILSRGYEGFLAKLQALGVDVAS